MAEPRQPSSEVLFDGLELRAIIEAAGHDRMWPTDFLELCISKWKDPSVRVDRHHALQGALGLTDRPEGSEDGVLSVDDLLQRLGATLIGLRIDDLQGTDLGLAA